jgi:predicted dehydrogenase
MILRTRSLRETIPSNCFQQHDGSDGVLSKLQDREFLRAVLDGRDPAVTGEEGRKVVAIIEAIYQSGRQSGRDASPVRFP